MNKEQYKKLNNYLNDLFIELEKKDFFLLDNIPKIAYLSGNFVTIVKKYQLKKNNYKENLTYNEVISLARNIIESLDSKYLNDFDNLLDSGMLEFDYESILDDSYFLAINNQKTIDIRREFSYLDVTTLVHEYMHYTNYKDKMSINRYLLTEFISIYFEIYGMNYLNENGISKDKLDYNDRIINTYRSASLINSYITSLLSFQKFGNIDSENISLINHYFCDITKEEFEEENLALLKQFDDIKKYYIQEIKFESEFDNVKLNCRLAKSPSSNYRYLIGTLLSIYALKNCNIKDIIYLNDHINDEKYAKMNLIELLKTINIDLSNNDLSNELLNCLKDYLDEHLIESKRVK